jgi:diphosphomevalonate decarboxylase
MLRTMAESPFYASWLDLAPRLFDDMKMALAKRDAPAVFELAERSALAMHASAMAAGVVYLRDASFRVMSRVKELRRRGVCAYTTSDAGPHVKVLVQTADVSRVRAELDAVPGLRIVETSIGEGARLL